MKAAAETAMSTVMETANKAVEVAQKAAADAMREAQAAAKRAEELARRVASEADAVLREKAKGGELYHLCVIYDPDYTSTRIIIGW